MLFFPRTCLAFLSLDQKVMNKIERIGQALELIGIILLALNIVAFAMFFMSANQYSEEIKLIVCYVWLALSVLSVAIAYTGNRLSWYKYTRNTKGKGH